MNLHRASLGSSAVVSLVRISQTRNSLWEKLRRTARMAEDFFGFSLFVCCP